MKPISFRRKFTPSPVATKDLKAEATRSVSFGRSAGASRVKQLLQTLAAVQLAVAAENDAAHAAMLTGRFESIAQGAVVNLTTEGSLDWVHWGLYSENSLDRKANATQQIEDLRLVAPGNPLGV